VWLQVGITDSKTAVSSCGRQPRNEGVAALPDKMFLANCVVSPAPSVTWKMMLAVVQ